ncbi:hypothetical protein MtrunA17_Chr7g0215221 [Medicago truncatula]|uniref:Uncharacterized protein n=1 Tax=Medicago truncatula TaxID=3880 RepID=A0A396GUG7_MEDTR|nr:hypothetical protein MtrunA17_Chr7g0215221 [Medicago truncatula]
MILVCGDRHQFANIKWAKWTSTYMLKMRMRMRLACQRESTTNMDRWNLLL